tara:strand:- start:505 stop:1014 length:510 start_codon:yes stop_codon:yes gene_type:complete
MWDDRELLKRAREDYAYGSDYATRDLFDRFEQMLDDKEPKSIVWEPKKDDEYFYVTTTEYLNSNIWVGSDYELALLKHHNIFRTRQLAEKAAKHQERYNMVLQAVLNLEPDQVVDWSDMDEAKYMPHFSYIHGLWKADLCSTIDFGYPVLTDERNVQPLLDRLNAEEIK